MQAFPKCHAWGRTAVCARETRGDPCQFLGRSMLLFQRITKFGEAEVESRLFLTYVEYFKEHALKTNVDHMKN